MNAKVCKFNIRYINLSCIDKMKVIWIFIVTVRNALRKQEGVKICFHINVNLIHMFFSVRFS